MSDLSGFGSPSEVTLAPDRWRDGTNVAGVPTEVGFRFSYGPGSFARHLAEAARLGLHCTIVDDPRLSSDVDLPVDLALDVAPLRAATHDDHRRIRRERTTLSWCRRLKRHRTGRAQLTP